jgi:hypothetical protein
MLPAAKLRDNRMTVAAGSDQAARAYYIQHTTLSLFDFPND